MYENIISLKNLLEAWKEFLRDKSKKDDVIEFSTKLSVNIFSLHYDLKNAAYIHGGYKPFNISDPKPRKIHKAAVRDRLLHHAIYRVLYPRFDKRFIHDSYSCRDFKGTHKAMNRFLYFYRKVSRNGTRRLNRSGQKTLVRLQRPQYRPSLKPARIRPHGLTLPRRLFPL